MLTLGVDGDEGAGKVAVIGVAGSGGGRDMLPHRTHCAAGARCRYERLATRLKHVWAGCRECGRG